VLAGDAEDGFGMLALLGGCHVLDKGGEEYPAIFGGLGALGRAD
jgi:hypothetical protein